MANVLVGAFLAGFFGLVGALASHRREHDRWIREARFAAYVELLREVDTATVRVLANEATRESSDPSGFEVTTAAIHEVLGAKAGVSLLGPPHVARLADKFVGGVFPGDSGLIDNKKLQAAVADRREAYIDACQAVLDPPRRRGLRHRP